MSLSSDYIRTSLQALYGNTITGADIRAWCSMNDASYQTVTKKIDDYKVGRGKWNLEVTPTVIGKMEQAYQAPAALPAIEQNLVPEKDDTFVKFVKFNDIRKIVESLLFYPTFSTGLSGNGKTFSVEQACAQLKRELIRVNITIETDEDDLIGGFRLWMATLLGIMDLSLKHSNEEQSCYSMKLTLLPTRFYASSPSLKVRVCS